MALGATESIQGSMWGLAIGDALGATVEFMSREEIRRQFGQLRDIQGGGWLQLAAGQFTDDTAMTIATAQGIIEYPQSPIEAIGRRYLAWEATMPPDIGNTVRLAFKSYRQNPLWEEAGRLAQQTLGERSAGNGGLMRIAPVGLAYWRHSSQRDIWARNITAMTHANALCQFLSLVYCSLLSACIDRKAARSAAYLSALSHGQGIMGSVIPAATIEQLESVDSLTYEQLASTGYVLDTFIAAVWCFLHHDSAEEAIVAAVNLGDDADTVGAVAGALVGAFYGRSALPERWQDAMLEKDLLNEVSEGLVRITTEYYAV